MKYLIVLLTALLLTGCFAQGMAHIYENRETGELLYCSNAQNPVPQDFDYKGTAMVAESDIVFCALN